MDSTTTSIGDVTATSEASQTSASASQTSSSRSRAKPTTYPKDYLLPKDIICMSQKVSVTFDKEVKGLGFIDSAAECKDIPVGTKMELPLWMAKVLRSRKCLTMDVPRAYNETYREILDADASMVDLHKQGPHFYTFGKNLVKMGVKDRVAIADSMVSTFHQRFHGILDQAMNASQDTQLTLLEYQSRLDSDELDVLAVGRKATEDFKAWESRTNDKLVANEMVASLNRRKRALNQLDKDVNEYGPSPAKDKPSSSR